MFYLHQEDLFVREYRDKFDDFMFIRGFQIDSRPTIKHTTFMFYDELKYDFKSEIILHIF